MILDKNGKWTKVWKKPKGAAKPQMMSSPKLLVNPRDEFINKVGLPLFAHRYYEIIDGFDSSAIPYLNTLLTTGNETAQHESLSRIRVAFQDMDDAYADHMHEALNDTHTNSAVDAEKEAAKSIGHYYVPRLKLEATAAWHLGQVAEEIGNQRIRKTTVASVMNYHYAFYKGNPKKVINDEMYWRGLSILVLSLPKDTTQIPESQDFIDWAAQHPDPYKIQQIASKRATLDISLLKELIGEDGKLAPVIADGML